MMSIALFSSCHGSKMVAKHEKHEHHAHWAYTGENNPSNWSHIKEEYMACAGNSQSPINIQTSDAKSAQIHELKLDYNDSKVDILNNGHTEEFVVSEGNSVNFDGKEYELKQFHMHTLSEHTVNGKHFPLEVHFVNKSKDNHYLVISILVQEGDESKFLSHYLKRFPETEGEYKGDGSFNIQDVLPNMEHYFHYKGSFTTPPCTEEVDWVVLKEHTTASKKQLKRLHDLMHDNYRPIQALNHRVIENQ